MSRLCELVGSLILGIYMEWKEEAGMKGRSGWMACSLVMGLGLDYAILVDMRKTAGCWFLPA